MFWGFGCDVFGRRWAFNLTLGVTGVFGMIAAGSPNFAAIGCFAALWSFGVGGNLPVDSAVFREFAPSPAVRSGTGCSSENFSICLGHRPNPVLCTFPSRFYEPLNHY